LPFAEDWGVASIIWKSRALFFMTGIFEKKLDVSFFY
jgi:hypothetical protein